MGGPIGGFLSIVLTVVAAIVALIFGIWWGTLILCVMAYVLFIIAALSCWMLKPPANSPWYLMLSPHDKEVALMFGLFVMAPGAATMWCGAINVFRMALVVFGAICLYKGLYWLGGLSLVYFAVTSWHVVRLDPFAFVGPQAAKGNAFSIAQIEALRRILEMKEVQDKAVRSKLAELNVDNGN